MRIQINLIVVDTYYLIRWINGHRALDECVHHMYIRMYMHVEVHAYISPHSWHSIQ